MHSTIDAHLHLSESKDDLLLHYAHGNGLRYTLKEVLSLMRRNSIRRGILLSPPLRGGVPLPNEDILDMSERSEGVLCPGLTVEPSRKAVSEAIRLARNNREAVKAFKVRLGYHSVAADAPVFGALYDFATQEGLPVLFHTGDTALSQGDLAKAHPLTVDRVANMREGLKIVLCHFGNPWFDDVAELIYKHPNVYADISGLTTGGGAYAPRFAKWLARRISEAVYFAGGAEKVIFGTDYPVTTPSDALGLVSLLKVSDADKESILWRTAEGVFGL